MELYQTIGLSHLVDRYWRRTLPERTDYGEITTEDVPQKEHCPESGAIEGESHRLQGQGGMAGESGVRVLTCGMLAR